MKTKAFNFIKKPKHISIHKWVGDAHYCAIQWEYELFTKKYLIGVWHIKYKDIDCNFS